MANKVVIDINADFNDNVSGKTKAASGALKDLEKNAKAATKEVDNLAKKKAEPKLNADNSNLVKKVNDSTSKLKKLGNTEATAKISVLDKVTQFVSKVTSVLKTFGGKAYNAVVNVKSDPALNALKKVSRAGEKIAGKTWSTVVKVKDLATAPLRGIKNMLFSIKSLALAITAGFAANKLIAEPLQKADSYSSAKIGFSTLLGEGAGQKMMDDLDEFAKKTPFKTSGVIDSARKMMAMGWDSENLLGDLEVFGNAAAATGNLNQGLESIVRAMSQIKTKGRLSTEELNQLAEAGISAKAMLAENLGYGTGDEGIAKMTEDLEKGAIASNVAIEALIAGMKKYDGMMDSMANETAEGLMSQIQDAFEINVVRKWGQGLQDGAKRGLGAVVGLLDEAEEALSEFGDMMYEIGEKASNWLADRFENAIQRITEITGTFEFQNADLGEKISMLWQGVIVDPLKEWWEGGGQQKTAETAGKIGSWMGKAITNGLLTLFGITDIFDDETAKQLGEEGGMSIAQSFAKGFKENFDGSAITDGFVNAISDIWGALPTWAKFLVGGYGAAKIGGGISSLAGGLASGLGTVKDIIGTTGKVGADGAMHAYGILGAIGSASKGTGILGLGSKTAIALGAGNLAGGASMGTAALTATGLAGLAGGVAGVAATGKGLYDAYGSYKAFKEGDRIEGEAKAASSMTTLSGVGMGAAVGATIGSIIPGIGTAIGGLIGAGLGGVAGWWGGDKFADNIRAAKFEAEGLKEEFKAAETEEEKLAADAKAMWENAKRHFGDIKLSMSEIQRMADQVVWGDDLGNFEQLTMATQAAENSIQQFKTATEKVNRWTWKASLGLKFNEDEKESIVAAFDEYVNSAKAVVENKHYEFTAAVGLLVDIESEIGKSIIDSGNEYYTGLTAELDTLQAELQTALDTALKDGVISADTNMKVKIGGVEVEGSEEELIAKIQEKIAEIEGKVAQAQAEAELEAIKVKFGSGNLDAGSFDSFMQEITSAIEERITANDTALTASITSLKLQLDDKAITQEEYDAQFQALVDGYTGKVDSIKAEVMDVELSIIGDAYNDLLGEDAKAQLATALQTAINEGITSEGMIEIDGAKLASLLQITTEDLEASGFSADNIQSMLSGVLSQMEAIHVDTELLASVGAITVQGASAEELTAAVQSNVPEEVPVDTTLVVTPYKQVQPIEKITAAEVGLENELPHNLLWNITNLPNHYQIDPHPTAADAGLKDSIDHTINVNITYKPNFLNSLSDVTGGGGDNSNSGNGNGGGGFRGGIFGGNSAMDAFARGGETDNSGIIGGSTRFIRVNEESPEMIIPLSSQRRERALKLWNKTGELLGVPGFARGGRSDGDNDEGIRFGNYGGGDAAGGQTVEIDVGGITVEINVDATNNKNIVDSVREQSGEIAEVIAGVLVEAFSGQYENTPLRGGVA